MGFVVDFGAEVGVSSLSPKVSFTSYL